MALECISEKPKSHILHWGMPLHPLDADGLLVSINLAPGWLWQYAVYGSGSLQHW